MSIKEIVRDIKKGKMNREIDEKYAGGFWDFAGEIVDVCHLKNDAEYELLREDLYGIFYEIIEECLKKIKGRYLMNESVQLVASKIEELIVAVGGKIEAYYPYVVRQQV